MLPHQASKATRFSAALTAQFRLQNISTATYKAMTQELAAAGISDEATISYQLEQFSRCCLC